MAHDIFAQYIAGAAAGMYLLTSLFLGLELTFDILHLKKNPITAVMRMGGITMLFDFIAILTGAFLTHIFAPELWTHVSHIFDGLVSILFCLTGFTLLLGKKLPLRLVIVVVMPMIILLAVGVIFNPGWRICTIITEGYLAILFIVQIIQMLIHDNKLKDFYSDIENRTTKWFLSYILWFVLIIPLYFVLYTKNILDSYGFAIYDVVMVCMYFFMGIQFFKQEDTIIALEEISDETPVFSQSEEVKAEEKEIADAASAPIGQTTEEVASEAAPAAEASAVLSARQQKIEEGLKRLMIEEKIFRNPELTIKDVCNALSTNNTYLYYYMHDVLRTRFYQYINEFRIEEAKRQLQDTDEKIENVAFSCGFNTYSTFFTAFRSATGKTPRQWRKSA